MESPPPTIAERTLPKQIGRYKILCELGQGAMAILYLGRAVGPGSFERLFAIKMIHDHLSREPTFVNMFLNEARLSARIHHSNVIAVYEVDQDNGRYFLAMDYMSGENLALTLKHTWNRGRPFPIDMATHIVSQACEGLHAAHELKDATGQLLGVVHRDVAPQNIMLGYDGTVRVMDFGIAKTFDSISETRPGTMKGTVAYMAPEQIRAESLDRRVDVFALGVVLWETTVGKRLFKSTNDINTAARVLRMTVPRPSTIRDRYPQRLENIVMKALARDPAERYPTARALGDDLQDFLAREGARVTPSHLERFMKDVFGPLYEQRAEMERKASAPVAPERVASIPRRAGETGSLSALSVGISQSIDAYAEQVLVQEMAPKSKPAAPPPAETSEPPPWITPASAAAASLARLASAETEQPAPVDAAKTDAAKIDAAKTDAAKTDAAKVDAAKIDAATTDAAKIDAAKIDAAKIDAAKTDAAKTDAAKTDAAKTDAAKTDAAKTDAAKTDAASKTPKPELSMKAQLSAVRAELSGVKAEIAAVLAASRTDATKSEPAKAELAKAELAKTEPAKAELAKTELAKTELAKADDASAPRGAERGVSGDEGKPAETAAAKPGAEAASAADRARAAAGLDAFIDLDRAIAVATKGDTTPAKPVLPPRTAERSTLPRAASEAAKPLASRSSLGLEPLRSTIPRPSDSTRPASIDAATPSTDAAKPSTFDAATPSADAAKTSAFDAARPSALDAAKPSVDAAKTGALDAARPGALDAAKPSAPSSDVRPSAALEALLSSLPARTAEAARSSLAGRSTARLDAKADAPRFDAPKREAELARPEPAKPEPATSAFAPLDALGAELTRDDASTPDAAQRGDVRLERSLAAALDAELDAEPPAKGPDLVLSALDELLPAAQAPAAASTSAPAGADSVEEALLRQFFGDDGDVGALRTPTSRAATEPSGPRTEGGHDTLLDAKPMRPKPEAHASEDTDLDALAALTAAALDERATKAPAKERPAPTAELIGLQGGAPSKDTRAVPTAIVREKNKGLGRSPSPSIAEVGGRGGVSITPVDPASDLRGPIISRSALSFDEPATAVERLAAIEAAPFAESTELDLGSASVAIPDEEPKTRPNVKLPLSSEPPTQILKRKIVEPALDADTHATPPPRSSAAAQLAQRAGIVNLEQTARLPSAEQTEIRDLDDRDADVDAAVGPRWPRYVAVAAVVLALVGGAAYMLGTPTAADEAAALAAQQAEAAKVEAAKAAAAAAAA
ncbi:protein kinase, partial [Myxococcota bacterium]|nr:protein kinase [Myxococcota bacterium]